jgi:hypothetical protein
MASAAASSDEFDSTRETGSARAGDPAASPVQPPARSPSANHADLSLLEKTRYTHFRDQTIEPPCFLCLMQEAEPDDAIFGSPSGGLISRVTAYWHTHYANQRPRKELAEACMELIRREQELWSFAGAAGEALAATTALSVYEHITEHLMDHESTAEDRILADLAHNASALQSLMYTAGTKGKREVDKEICKQHCAVASLFLRGVQAKRARREKDGR